MSELTLNEALKKIASERDSDSRIDDLEADIAELEDQIADKRAEIDEILDMQYDSPDFQEARDVINKACDDIKRAAEIARTGEYKNDHRLVLEAAKVKRYLEKNGIQVNF